jgi:hypothetical protein
MSHRSLVSISVLSAVIAVVMLAPGPAAGQAAAAANKSTSSRTPWGDPDLQGIWSNTTTTRLERPAELAGKQTLTDEERQALDAQAAQRRDRPPAPGNTGAYNSFWTEPGRASQQTSLVIDPPDGRVPFTPEERKRSDAFNASLNQDGNSDSWVTRGAYERCITRGMPGAMMPGFYNHNYQILQTPGYVVILVEMIHDARIIPVDGRAHLGPQIRQWLGDSRGRWEGNTLVVETTNFTDKVTDRGLTVFGAGRNARIVERFTRTDANTIDYRFTVEDASLFTKPWTAAIPMTKIEGPLFEYACHEGNYGMENILQGARAREKAQAAKTESR